MEKFTFILPCPTVLDAIDIFSDVPHISMEYVSFIPYGKSTLILTYTEHDFYLKIYRNDRIPKPFILFPKHSKDFMEILKTNTTIKVNLDFNYSNFNMSYWDRSMQMNIVVPNVFSPNVSFKNKDEEMLEQIKKFFLEVSSGTYNYRNKQTCATEEKEPYHMKIYPRSWMVGKHFKLYACRNVQAYIFQRHPDEIYGSMAWTWNGEEQPFIGVESFKNLLKSSEIKKAEDVRTDLLVSNHHGVHMSRVFAQYYPDIFNKYAEGEYRHLFFEDGFDLTPDQHQIVSEIWDEITQGYYTDEKGEIWQMMIGPDGDLIAYNKQDFDCLSDKEQEKFHDF